jgi:preprotein translocase subunit SecF
MMFGVVLVGTYTSVFIASPILIYLGVGTSRMAVSEPEPEPEPQPVAAVPARGPATSRRKK